MADPAKNFAIGNVSTGYSAGATTVALAGGVGSRFPDPGTDGAFNVVWWNATDYDNPSDDPNREIVRVTARSTDTLTITRAQEGTSASSKNTADKTYKMALVFTKKVYDDIWTAIAASLTASSIGVTVQAWDADLDTWATKTAPSGTVVGTTDSQTLTNKVLTAATITTSLTPTSNDGAALGSGTLMFSDLFLASGGVINFNNGDMTITHSSDLLSFGGGNLALTGAAASNRDIKLQTGGAERWAIRINSTAEGGSNAGSDFQIVRYNDAGVAQDSPILITRSTGRVGFITHILPQSNDGASLGVSGTAWSDIFLATGAVLDFGSANVVLTHSSGILTMGTGDLRITTAGTNAASVVTVGGTQTLTNKTLTSPVIAILASNTLTLGTGTFTTLTFDAGATDPVITASSGVLTVSTGDLRVTTAGTNAASVVTVDGTQTLGNKTLTSPVINTGTIGTSLLPTANDGAALGSGATSFSDLFLASGAVINFNNGNATITHSAGLLTSNVDIAVPDEAYGAGWNGSLEVPTKNAVYDKIEALVLGGGTGDVVGPASSTDNALPRFDGTGGKTLQDSSAILADTGTLTLTNNQDAASVQVLVLNGDRATMAANDEAYISLNLSDSGGAQNEFGRITWVGVDLTDTSEDSAMDLSVIVAGTLVKRIRLFGSEFSPFSSDGTALGSTSRMWADLFLASGGVINFNNGNVTLTHSAGVLTSNAQITATNFVPSSTTIPSNGMYLPAANTLGFAINSALEIQLTATALSPGANDGTALGTTTLGWADLFGATGFVLNIANGNWVMTHSSAIMTVGTGDLRVTTAGTNTASVVTVGGTQTLTSKTLTSARITTDVAPTSNDGATLGTSSLGFADLYLATGGQIFVNNAAPKRTIILSAAGGSPTATAGCSDATRVESATNKVNYWVLDFDTASEENAFWVVQMPDNWDGSTLTAKFIWTNAAGLTTETVTWGIKARAYNDDDAIDQAWGTEVTQADTWLAQNDIHMSAVSGAITVGGSPAGGRPVMFNVARKVASDNLTGDARLISVQIEYGINAYSD